MIDFNDKRQVAKANQYTTCKSKPYQRWNAETSETQQKYDFSAAMVAPCYIELAKDVLKGTGFRLHRR